MSTHVDLCIYLGPNRPLGLPLMQNALLRGSPETIFPQAAALLQDHKELRTLFVPVDDLATARMLLNMPGTALYNAYETIKNASARARKK